MLKLFVLFIMQSRLYEWLITRVIPFVRLSLYYPASSGPKFYQAYKKLRPGDFILTNDSHKLTSLLIPGEWSHAGLCVSLNGVFEVAEMTHNHYEKSTFFKLFHEADRVAILRCPAISNDPEYLNAVIEKCKSFEGAKYDIHFDLGVKALYCSELVYQSDFEHRIQLDLSDIVGIKRKYISPDGLFKSKNCVVIYDTKYF